MAGNWWEQDQVVQPVADPSVGGVPGFVPVTGPSPAKALELPIKQADLAAAQAKLATAPYDARTAAANAAKAEAEASKMQAEAAGKPDPALSKAQSLLSNDEMLGALDDARRFISAGRSTGLPGQILRKVGGTNATDLAGALSTIGAKTTLNNLSALKAGSATGASGLGALSEREGQMLRDSIASINQDQSQDALLANLAKVEMHYRRLAALTAGHNPDDPSVAGAFGIAAPPSGPAGGADEQNGPQMPGAPLPGAGGPPGGSGGGGSPLAPSPNLPMALSQNGKETITDPTMLALNGRVASMIKAGASSDDVKGYLNSVQPGLGERSANIDQWVAFHKQNPRIPVNVRLDQREVPLSFFRGVANQAAQSPIGAGVMSAGNAMVGGALPYATGNPALSQAALAGVQQQNPISSLIGTAGGGALATAGIETGLGKFGVSSLARPILADALYGGGSGAIGNPDNRLGGALLGGAAGVGGGMFGRATGRVAGRALQGVTDASTRYLDRLGVPMTAGQMLGGGAKTFEDRLAGYPIVGDAINTRRGEGLRAFNKAVFDEALAPIGQNSVGQIGEGGVQNASDLISDAYQKALGGSRVTIDPRFTADLGAAKASAAALPRVGSELPQTIDSTINPYIDDMGGLTGENMQPLMRELGGVRRGYANDPLGYRIGGAVRGAEDAVSGMFDRQAPGVMRQYRAANSAYRANSVIADAVNRAVNSNQGGGVFTPAQLGLAARGNSKKLEGAIAAASGKRPFFNLQRAGQEVLPSTIPDSGTAGRLAIPLALGALGGGGDYVSEDGKDRSFTDSLAKGAGIAAFAAAPYSQLGRSLIQRGLMARRPDLAVKLGKQLMERANVAGLLANPLAVQSYALPSYAIAP